jgi:hypothetical protein
LAGAFLPDHGYNYFVLLKWVVFLTAGWAAVILSKRQNSTFFIFVAVAIIHNPFLKFHFSRDIWLVLDGVTAAWFAFHAIRKKIYQISFRLDRIALKKRRGNLLNAKYERSLNNPDSCRKHSN